MRKYLSISVFSLIIIIAISLFYLSYFGIKTDNFNSLIKNKIKNYDSRISMILGDVFLKLNLQELSIKLNTKNTKLNINQNYIKLNNVDVHLNLIKFLKKENSIQKIKLISDENKIKNVSNFLSSYRFNFSRSLLFEQIKEGTIQAEANIYFDDKNQNNLNYDLNGNIYDATINLIGADDLKKINFSFDIKKNKYIFNNINFLYQNAKYKSNTISITNVNDIFEIKGDLNNKKDLININSLSNFFNINLDFLDKKEIFIETKNEFAFKVNSKLSIKDFEFKSNLKFDEIFLNKKYQDLIYLKDGIIKFEYIKKNLSVDLNSKFVFFENEDKKKINTDIDKNNIQLNLTKKNDENYKIKGNLTNDKTYLDTNNALFKILKIDRDILSEDKILIDSNNEFAFQIGKNNKVKNLSINSTLNFDKLKFNKNFQNLIYLKNGKIVSIFKDKSFDVKIDSKYVFFTSKYNSNEKDQNIILKIKNNEKNSIDIETFFKTNKAKINSKEITKYLNINNNLIKDQYIDLESDNKINFSISGKNIVKDLKIKSFLKFDKLKINYKSNKIRKFVKNYDDKIYIKGENVELNYFNGETEIKGNGKFSLNDEFENFNIKIINKKNNIKFDTFLNLKNSLIKIEQIDYLKTKKKDANLSVIGYYDIDDKYIYLDESNYLEGKNNFFISNLNLNLQKDFKIKSIDKLELNFLNNQGQLNDIKILKYKDKFQLIGKNYDGKSLIENIVKGNSNGNFFNIFENLNSEVILSIDQFYLGNSSFLNKIIGRLVIKKNKLEDGKIDAFVNKKNKFSYSLKTSSNNEKITNLYIEEPEPFIKNYKFVKGFKEGRLEFTSTEINNVSKSKLNIYDFKVKKVPLLAKVLTLASLQGIADILTGEGIRFDEFEMEYIKRDKNNTTIKEMYAIGPAISILMDGYIVKDELTSLRGTLVPATTINKSIKKIPIIGNILVGKKVGEGVFGVSFKIKGHPKDLKTTVNPVKTLTPRFITRTLEKLKGN